MRSLVLRIALSVLPLGCYADSDQYLENLMRRALAHPAPSALAGFMAKLEGATLQFCLDEPRWGLQHPEDFFAARRIPLGNLRGVTFLVFPTMHCPMYFGNSAIPYWIVQELPVGQFRVLHSSANLVVRVLPKRSHGLRSIEDSDGRSEYVNHYEYDGSRYRLQ